MIGDILQPTHLLFILAVALLVLGPKKLPEVGRQLGSGLRDFRAAINGEHTEQHAEVQHHTDAAAPAVPTSAPDTMVEHQFAHETTEPLPGEHQPTHDAEEAAPAAHEFAHSASGAASSPDTSGASGGGHEFAAQPDAPTERQPDSLT